MDKYWDKPPSFWTKLSCFLLGHRWEELDAAWGDGKLHFCNRCSEAHYKGRPSCYGNCPDTEECDCGHC